MCGEMPDTMTFSCHGGALLVRPRDAHLTYEMVPENQFSTEWVPSTRQSIWGVVCSLAELEGERARVDAVWAAVRAWLDSGRTDDEGAPDQRSIKLGLKGTFIHALYHMLPSWPDDPGAKNPSRTPPPFFFAKRRSDSPGVEFAYANAGSGIQHGTYRWIHDPR